MAGLWLIFVVHSGVVQYLSVQGQRYLNAAIAGRENPNPADGPSSEDQFHIALGYLKRANQRGLLQVASLHAKLAGAYSNLGDHLNAQHHYRRAVELGPKFVSAHYELYRYANARNDTESALAHLNTIMDVEPDFQNAHC